MKIYKKLTKRNYKDYERDFLSLKENHLKAFIDKIVASGEATRAELDFSPKSLIAVWKYAYPKIEMISPTPDYPEDKVPIWFYIQKASICDKDKGYSIKTLWFLDSLAYYFGEVLIQNNKGLKWESYYTEPRMMDQYKPLIKGLKIPINPFDSVVSSAINTWIGDEEIAKELSNTNLYDLYNIHCKLYKV